jgi:hypothetical protein
VDVRADGGLAIDSVAFPNTPADGFWSSSPNVANTGNSWVVHFSNGNTSGYNNPSGYHVRCVR